MRWHPEDTTITGIFSFSSILQKDTTGTRQKESIGGPEKRVGE